MAQFVDNLLITLSLNASKFTAGVKSVAGELRNLDTNIQKSGSRMALFGSTVANAFAAGQVVRGINSTIQAAANLTNSVATAEQVFGEAFETIDKFADAAVESVGLSKQAAIQATTFLGGLGKAAGIAGEELATFSIDMIKLSADLAASFNTNVQDAVEAIQSGFSGSSIEPLRRYNVVITDTTLKNEYFALTGERITGVLQPQQRMLAFISQLYKQTADYQGQWNRESDQALAAQQKLRAEFENMKATIGESLIPAFTSGLHALQGIVTAFNAMPKSIQGMVSSFSVFGIAALGASRAIKALENSLLGFGMSATNVTRISRSLMGGFIALDVALLAYSINAQQAADNTRNLNQAVDELNDVDPEDFIDSFRQLMGQLELAGKAEGFVETLRYIADQSVAALVRMRQQVASDPALLLYFDAMDGKIDGAAATLKIFDDIINEHIVNLAGQANAQEIVGRMIAGSTGATEDNTVATEDNNEVLERNIDILEETAQAWKDFRDSVKDAATDTRLALANFRGEERVKAMNEALIEFFESRGAGLTFLDSMGDIQESFKNVFKEIRQNEWRIPDIFDTSSKRAAEFRDMIGQAADAVNAELARELESSGGDVDAVRERVVALRDELIAGLGKVTGLDVDVDAEKAKLQALVDLILPTDAEIEVGVKLQAEAKNKLLAQLAIDFLKGTVPTVATQLEIDFQRGDKSPRGVILTAQRIARGMGAKVDFGIEITERNKRRIDKELVDFARTERTAIKLGITIPEAERLRLERRIKRITSEFPPIPMKTQASDLDETAAEIEAGPKGGWPDIPVYVKPVFGPSPFQGGYNPFAPPSGGTGPFSVGLTATNGTPAPVGYRNGVMPTATYAAAPPVIHLHTTIQAGVVGDSYAVMRVIEDATRRNARLMPFLQ